MKSVFNTLRMLPLLLAAGAAWAGQVDINTADAESLAENLVGVGDARAEAIVAYRDQLGPFLTADDLVLVKGIGEATIARNRDSIIVSVPAR